MKVSKGISNKALHRIAQEVDIRKPINIDDMYVDNIESDNEMMQYMEDVTSKAEMAYLILVGEIASLVNTVIKDIADDVDENDIAMQLFEFVAEQEDIWNDIGVELGYYPGLPSEK